ncbi:MAG: SGNH/GDSL hydrolase family protein [Planctomycetes bacterium]|nr:SGNH/GDSL hydrolase family protein [Planctomycetota bacterium]
MDAPRPKLPWPRKLGLCAASTLAALGGLELLLRLTSFTHFPAILPPIVWNDDEDRNLRKKLGMFVEDPAQLWVPKPGVEVPYGSAEGERINSQGFRGPERGERRPGVLRVFALGDSSTFGMGVPYPDTWCAQLEAQLAREGVQAEVLDGGVIGFTIDQGLERWEALGRSLHPDVVVAAFGAINEHLWCQTLPDRPKIDERKRPKGLAGFLLDCRYQVRLLHLSGWVLDTARGEDREAMRERLREKRRQQDAFNVNAGQPDWPGERRVGLTRFAAALDELDRRVRAEGARLVLVSMPRHPEREAAAPVLPLYNRAVLDGAARLGAPCFDARGAVLQALTGPPERDFEELFLDAYHPNREGHGLIAAGLAPLIKSLSNESSRASAR